MYTRCTNLVELMVNFVENECPVIVSCVQLNDLVNWREVYMQEGRGGKVVGGQECPVWRVVGYMNLALHPF